MENAQEIHYLHALELINDKEITTTELTTTRYTIIILMI